MTTRRLRIMHNGHIHQTNPHWHLWIYKNGNLRGEIIGRQSDFKGIQGFEKQLSESDISTLFSEAETMRPHFKMREVMCLPDGKGSVNGIGIFYDSLAIHSKQHG